ncbi:DNA/RNA non-specific endonuclease [Microvirga sp. TS319]|uniref:DNA/RNA non-specific endonuclease n=1 Tax=Microvirga sp. TS319 TaxID=3241165 RepID=UPI00351A9A2E
MAHPVPSYQAVRSSMRLVAVALGIALAACSLASQASAESCPQHFFSGVAPQLLNPKLEPKTRQICYSEFALLHSGLTRTPLWVAEHFTPERVAGARDLNRVNNFHADANLPISERAELSDYARSGYDRGHMAPSGDMATPEGMAESFSLANMVPQDRDNNRNLWERIERAVRQYAERREIFVVTGPIFQGENVQSLKGRVLVPTHLAKAVYDPQRNAGAAYLVLNQPGNDYKIVSLVELQQLTGIDAFPHVAASVKQTAMELPTPQLRRSRRNAGPAPRSPSSQEQPAPSSGSQTGDFLGGILNAIDNFGRR